MVAIIFSPTVHLINLNILSRKVEENHQVKKGAEARLQEEKKLNQENPSEFQKQIGKPQESA